MEYQITISESYTEKYERSSHAVGVLMWHFEWCTKYRYKMFGKEEYRNLITACIRRADSTHGIKIIEKKDVDMRLMWFLYRYKVLKWDIEEYEEMPTFFESNYSGRVKKMLKELKQMSIESSFHALKIELIKEIDRAMLEKASCDEEVSIKNIEKDLKDRKMFMVEVEKDEKEFNKIKMERDVMKELKEEDNILRKRIIELESNCRLNNL